MKICDMSGNVHESVDPKNQKKYKVLRENERKTIENRINNLYKKGWVLVGEVKYKIEETTGVGIKEKFVATMKNTEF